ncbi:MAG: tRNA (N6-isopentenyl adenosine(37)-C2)-methylthiotransferase MiaB [Candidatus Zixiibacteriota bacterium]|nr:MAG: tRNA (N6-isopentenyl adenosine(37)-C2)-methylthiotransferase MiaB [candidate division Zixibacteria bacterium]
MNTEKEIRTFHISTYGCQMNLADSSTLAAAMTARGFRRVSDEKRADLIILNTCSVRDKAEQRVLGRLGELAGIKRKNPDLRLAVVGCMAQRLGDGLLKQAPQVDYVLGTDRVFDLPDVIARANGSRRVMTALGRNDIDTIAPAPETPYSGFVTISRGCDNYCTYCIVPFVRGKERAHSADFIIDSMKRLADRGVVEVTLLGQNVNSYRCRGTDFPDLLMRAAGESGVRRLRFMTSHPIDLSTKLVDVMARCPAIMPHIHLPLQSGADRVLKNMGREYTIEHYLKTVEYIRSRLDYVSLTTDLIVGFPGETESEYEATLEAVRTIRYDSAFMFRYSVRPGTAAADYDDDVTEDEKIRRLKKLIALQQEISFACNRREVGRVRHSLVEGTSRRDRDYLRARTEGNKTVLIPAGDLHEGDIVRVKITSADAFTLHGEVEGTCQ